jgi:hypothetical protein
LTSSESKSDPIISLEEELDLAEKEASIGVLSAEKGKSSFIYQNF